MFGGKSAADVTLGLNDGGGGGSLITPIMDHRDERSGRNGGRAERTSLTFSRRLPQP